MWLNTFFSFLKTIPSTRRPARRREQTSRLRLEMLENRLTPSFTWYGDFPGHEPPGVEWEPQPLVADFTSDGIVDQIMSDWDEVVVRPGRGDGTYGEAIRTPSPYGFQAAAGGYMAAADFNGDGQVDVATANFLYFDEPAYGSVLLGRGDGSFNWAELHRFGNLIYPQRIGTGDFFGTGRMDIAVAGEGFSGEPVVMVLANNGDWGGPPHSGPNLRIDNAAIDEGNTSTVSASFTVTLSALSSEAITVDYSTAGGTAIADSDFQAAGGTLTFAPGQTSQTITVPVNGDRVGESNETFVVLLSNAANATIVDSQGVGTIMDDEPRISIGDLTRSEGRKNQTTLFTFTVTLSAAYDQPVTMSYQTVNGTAKAGEDYAAESGTLTFAPGETTKTITIEVKGDNKKEASETFYLDLFGLSSNSQFSKNRGIGNILNDD